MRWPYCAASAKCAPTPDVPRSAVRQSTATPRFPKLENGALCDYCAEIDDWDGKERLLSFFCSDKGRNGLQLHAGYMADLSDMRCL